MILLQVYNYQLIYEKSSQKLYYYEKWTQANITLLRVGTNYIKKQIKSYKTSVEKSQNK